LAYKAGNIHHIRPQSRGGGPKHEVEIDRELHSAWHSLFNNDLLEEVFVKLELPCWRNKDGSLNTKFLSEKMKRAWALLFGNASCDEAVKIIEKMFIERDRQYLFREAPNKKRRI
jgi:hypothetical protein